MEIKKKSYSTNTSTVSGQVYFLPIIYEEIYSDENETKVALY